MINVKDLSSIPPEIEQAVAEYTYNLPRDVISSIKSASIKNDSDVRCAIEGYFAPYKAEILYRNVLVCLGKCNIRCFHATRLVDENDVWTNGLQTNSPERYFARLSSSMQKLGIQQKNTEEAIELVKHEYNRKYGSSKPQLCFFTPIDLISDDELAGYDQFCQNIGGELARWSLKEKMPGVYQQLAKSGFAAIVEFEFHFSDMTSGDKDRIAYQFITHYASKNFFSRSYPICFDANTDKDVLPAQIIKIHRYCGEMDYE